MIVTAVIYIERELATETVARHVVARSPKVFLDPAPAKSHSGYLQLFFSFLFFSLPFLQSPPYKGSISLRAQSLIVLS